MKTIRLSLFAPLAIAATLLFATSCDNDDDMPTVAAKKSIAEIAQSDTTFSILVSALQKANLVSTLNGSGDFTVFAPTNTAFRKLFATLKVSGINDLSAAQLTPILLYHVVGKSVVSSKLTTSYVNTLSNYNTTYPMSIYVNVSSGVKINNTSKVTAADIMASNGVVHVVDAVLLPPSVVGIAINNPNFSILVDAVVKAGLVNALSAAGPFTIFAPTNEAFTALFTSLKVSGVADLTAEQLTPILTYHVLGSFKQASSITTGSYSTLNGAALQINASTSGVKINTSTDVVVTDLFGTNGVVHAINKVLLPPS